jgi:glycosyltransferase involved in cell wall biosynthesis
MIENPEAICSGPFCSAPRGGVARSRLAVLIPAYRDQAGLERSLNSLSQDGADFDAVVVDDGSEPPIRVPDSLPFRVTVLRLTANRGITSALNAGLAHIVDAGYACVARLDCGDVSLPGRMAAQLAFMESHPDHAVVGCWTEFVDPAGRSLFAFRPPTDDADLRRFQRYQVGFVHSAVMLRVAALEAVGCYDERYTGAEDYDLFLRLARRYKLANLPTIYVKYEVNPRSLSRRRFRHGIVRLRVQARHFEPRSPHAWLGFSRNVLLLFLTRALVVRIKSWLARRRNTAFRPDRL